MKTIVKENVEEINCEGDDNIKALAGWGYRHQQCVVLFCCVTTAYSLRACMGVALVAMIINDSDNEYNNSVIYQNNTVAGNVELNITTSTINNLYKGVSEEYKVDGFLSTLLLTNPYPKFNWSKKIQDTILASFFWGYMLLQIPAGQLAHRFGSRYLLSGALFINCVVSFSLPWAAYYGGWTWVLVFRITQGLSQACIIPGTHTHLGKWTPLKERSRLSAWAYGGQALGPVLGLPITGFIAASPLGWPGIFRFYGLLSGLVGCLIWWVISDTPAKHPKVSPVERQYIENDLGDTDDSKKPKSVPWSKILTHRGMYAICIAHMGQTWGQLTIYSEVPAFMDKIMGVNIKANGLLTALPFLAMWFTNFFFSWVADMLIVKNILNVTHTRKLANSVGCIPAAIGLIVLAFVPKNILVVESLLVFICSFTIATNVGVFGCSHVHLENNPTLRVAPYWVNHIDISPNFSGTMMSISNFVANFCGSLAPTVAGFILTDVTSEYLWRKVFLVAAGIYFFTNLLYVLIGTAERAVWNDPSEYIKTLKTPETEPILTKD